MTVPDPIARLRALRDAATPGPWKVRVTEDGHDPRVYVTGLMSREGRDPDTVPPKFYVAYLPPMTLADSEPDAALIVAMHAALPALLDLWEAAEEVVDDWWTGPSKLRLENACAALRGLAADGPER